jgi:hypothetical protein
VKDLKEVDLKALYQGCVDRDEYVDQQLDLHQERLTRHRGDLAWMEKELRDLKATVGELVQDKVRSWMGGF